VSDEREWVVMLHARSTIRLRDDPHVVINPDSSSTGPVLGVRIRNTFSKITDDRLLVTGLFVEARGMAAGPDSAVGRLTGWALPLFQVIATAGNGAVDEPVDMVVHAPPVGKRPGRFLERRSCGAKDPAAVVRSIDAADLLTVLKGLNGHVDEQRLQRAMAHYRQALGELDPFNRVRCAESLFIACENLERAVLRRLYREAGLPDKGASKHKLAVAAGFKPPNGCSRQHLSDFDSYVRAHYIFDDQEKIYRNLLFASNHFEHGSRGFDKIQDAADVSADKAFGFIRRAILREIGVPNDSPLVTEVKYQHPLAGWPPALEVSGSYTSGRDGDWPNFYGVSVFPEILDIEDLDDDQKRNVKLTFTGSGAALLSGQEVTLEKRLWAMPSSPERKAEWGEPEVM
jgi:hypothetical protein